MKNRLLVYCLSIVFVAISGLVIGQRLEYKMKAGGKDLGNFFVERHTDGDSTVILLQSFTDVNLLVTSKKVKYTSYSVFVKGVLRFSEVRVIENDKLKEWTTTKKTLMGYATVKWESGKETKNSFKHSGIKGSSSNLFFNIPAAGDTTYAEKHANFEVVSAPGNEHRQVKNISSGSKTDYYYEQGVANRRIIEYPIMNFQMFLDKKLAVSGSVHALFARFESIKN